jgi:predicted transcriptional regulator
MATKQKRPVPPTAVRFDSDVRRWLVEYAAEHDQTVSQVVRAAVREYRLRAAFGWAPDAARKAGGP